MKFLLTASGITNKSIHNALVELLGKPIAESTALVIPTSAYYFKDGPFIAYRLVSGTARSPMCELGWKSLGVLELTALPSVDKDNWIPLVQATDALLVGGGDPMYLCDWMRRSGFADLLPSLRPDVVYVGISGGSMAVTPSFGETYNDRDTAGYRALGLVDFALGPHLDHPDMPDNSMANYEHGPPAYRSPRTRSTIRRPSRWRTARSRSFPRGTGSCLRPRRPHERLS